MDFVVITPMKPNQHVHAYCIMLITMALKGLMGRDRIARYCGGFEIHCRKTRGFKSLSRRLTCKKHRDFLSIQILGHLYFQVINLSIFQSIFDLRHQELLSRG